ncbi:MAG TPA: RDD family protein [Polyangiaceae bacterium]|jgi:uncharacterized RDD family membrane protein YckC|nr:RDD family protein [Polyangiaceae bacterium]
MPRHAEERATRVEPARPSDIAGPGSRFCAAALDTALASLSLLIVAGTVAPRSLLALGASDGSAGQGLPALPVLAVAGAAFVYQGVSETLVNGRTLGKRVMGIRVISADGAPLSKLQATVRNLLRPIDFLPLGYAVGGLLACLGSSAQRLGDLVARTVVVREAARIAARAERGGWSVAPAAPQSVMPLRDPSFELTAGEQAIVTGFLERRAELTPSARAKVGEQLATRLFRRHGGAWIAPESYLERLAVGRHRG